MHEQSKYSETKNEPMIVFTSAIFIGIISNIENIRNLITFETDRLPCFNEIAFKTVIILILITNIASFVFPLLSFLPKINQKIIERDDRKADILKFYNSGNRADSNDNLSKHNVLLMEVLLFLKMFIQ